MTMRRRSAGGTFGPVTRKRTTGLGVSATSGATFTPGLDLFGSLPGIGSGFMALEPTLKLKADGQPYTAGTITTFAGQPYVVNQAYQLDNTLELKGINANGLMQGRTAPAGQASGFAIEAFQAITYEYPVRVDMAGTLYGFDLHIEITGTQQPPAPYITGDPTWHVTGFAIPNDWTDPARYATAGGIAWSSDLVQSENMGKTAFCVTGLDGSSLPIIDVSAMTAQIDMISAIRGATVSAHWHGLFWHEPTALHSSIANRLTTNPGDHVAIAEALADRAFAARSTDIIDVNEVTRAISVADTTNNYIRGPINTTGPWVGLGTSNGSRWVEAALQASYTHGAHWWLPVFARATANGQICTLREFDINAGAPLGEGSTAPAGYTDASAPRKIDRAKMGALLDVIDYAHAAGFDIGWLEDQMHLNTSRIMGEMTSAYFYLSLSHKGMQFGIGEMDVEASGLPVGEANDSGSAQALAFAADYAKRAVRHAGRFTRLSKTLGWTDWTPAGNLPRRTLISRTGVTAIGQAVQDAITTLIAPTARTFGPSLRHYVLTDPTGTHWRSYLTPASRAFAATQHNKGVYLLAGTGGAVLPLSNANFAPGGPAAPMWWTGTALEDNDPRHGTVRVQFRDEGGSGMRVALMDATDTILTAVDIPATTYRHVSGATIEDTATRVLDGNNCIALTWSDGACQVSVNGSQATAEQAYSGTPAKILLLGDKVASATTVRAQFAQLFRDRLRATSLPLCSTPEIEHMPSAAEITAGTNEYTPPSLSYVPSVNVLAPDGWTLELGWTNVDGTLTHSGATQGAGVITRASQTVALVVGVTYQFGFTVESLSNVENNELFAFIGPDNIFGSITATGRFTHTFVASSASATFTIRNSAAGEGDEAATISNVYVRDIA